MRLLLDTHALLWSLHRPDALDAGARSAIEDGRNEVMVSAASVWEIAIKRALGKLKTPEDLVAAIGDAAFGSVPITIEHAWAAGSLPPHHRDPFDRMLIAQATVEGLIVVTRDPAFEPYGVATLSA